MPGSIQFKAADQYQQRVERLETRFKNKGLAISDNARVLFALAMQAQRSDNILEQNQIFENLDRIEDQIVQYYVHTYGEKPVDFNRAFHLVADLGPMMKYPWKPTPE